jgi:hypothetical protein
LYLRAGFSIKNQDSVAAIMTIMQAIRKLPNAENKPKNNKKFKTGM